MASEIKTNIFVDRSKWGPGPWDKEPDEWFWYDESTSYLCLVRRHPIAGTLCGYVGVGQGNPLFKKAYDPANITEEEFDTWNNLQVHGGVSFVGKIRWGSDEMSPETRPGELPPNNGCWWVGFDCTHFGDGGPGEWTVGGLEDYKGFNYVRDQVTLLALQLEKLRLGAKS